MAVTKTVLKKTHQEAVVKIGGTAGNATVSLASDLLPTGQGLDGATQTVNIVGVMWTGELQSKVVVSRGATNVLTGAPENSGYLDFGGQILPPDNIANTTDITVTISGGEAQVYLKLRKVGGYKTFIQPEQYGPYDDPTTDGASTTMSGSPDKV